MCWGLWSVRKRPNAVFPERKQEKKSRDPQRESTKEPPRSDQGAVKEHTFGSNGPMDAQEREERTKSTARGHETRDEDRISHALGTRPGEFSFCSPPPSLVSAFAGFMI